MRYVSALVVLGLCSFAFAQATSRPASQPAIIKERLVGAWDVNIGDVQQTLTLEASGNFYQEGNTGAMNGTWALEGNALVLTANSGLKIRSPILRLTDTQLTVRLMGLETITYTKQKP